MPRLLSGLVASFLLLAPAALAVVPAPPDQIAYSGVLGTAGPVDLTARLYDAASGGALLFKQSFTGVALTDGHFTVKLGPTGAATDSPANPLTTSLRAALTGDLAASTGRFVEITVNTDPPLARVQLVLVPYAMRADHALTADVAVQALDAQAVGGTDGSVVGQLFQAWNFDGGPPSTDPREGTSDTDGDGQANFVDSDNDNDGINDSNEVSSGSNINVVTPTVGFPSPTSGFDNQTTPVTVNGTGFLPGLTATLGTQSFNPAVVTPTSFSITAGPQPAGTVNLAVTNSNGETGTRLGAFTFTASSSTPIPLFGNLSYVAPTQLVARGEQLLASGLVTFGNNRNRYSADTVVDANVVFDLGGTLSGTVPAQASWNSSRVIYGLRGWATADQVQLLRDNNGDKVLSTGEAIVIESPGVDPKTQSPSLTFDASDRPGGGYLRNLAGAITAMAFHDRDGNGSFGGTNEVVAIEPVAGATDSLGEAAFDPSGRLAYVYYNTAGGLLRAAWDRSGDGDFNDTVGGTPEVVTVATLATPACLGMAFDAAGRLTVLAHVTDTPFVLRRDLSGDGDFGDAGEVSSLPSPGGIFACDVTAASAGNRVVVAYSTASTSPASLKLACDLNDDGDYLDANENVTLATGLAALAVTESASGAVRILTGSGVLLGPVR